MEIIIYRHHLLLDPTIMSASLKKSANGLKVSWTSHPESHSILVEFKDVDDVLEWIIMPTATSSSAAIRGVSKPAFIANQQVEIRGIPQHALGAHKFEAVVHSCYLQAMSGAVSSYQVAQSHRATCSRGGQDDDLERLFGSQLRLASSRTVSRSYRGKCIIPVSALLQIGRWICRLR